LFCTEQVLCARHFRDCQVYSTTAFVYVENNTFWCDIQENSKNGAL
jgi:hypothetical protein